MPWNEENPNSGAGLAVRAPDLECLLFACDREAAKRQVAMLEAHGIFAQDSQPATGAQTPVGLGVPVVVTPGDQERASMILAAIEAIHQESWYDGEDDLDEDDFDDDEDDDEDDFFPDDDEEDEDDEDDFDDDLDDG